MGNLVLKGHISYATKRKYRWVAEFGKNTCEKCASLDGQEFDEDNVPYWPHPNCRCRVEEISIVDEIESEINEYREEIEQLKMQANELLGDVNVLREKIEQLKVKTQQSQNSEARTLDIQLTHIEYEIYKLIDKIQSLTIEIISKNVIQKIEKEIEDKKKKLSTFKNGIEDLIVEKADRDNTIIVGSVYSNVLNMPEAYNLLKIGLNVDNYNQDYVKSNGKLYPSIDSLNNYKLQKDIRRRIAIETDIKDCKVFVLNPDSSIANKIQNSSTFKEFLNDNKDYIKKHGGMKNTEITFSNIDKDLYSTFHWAEIKNIYVDSEENLNLRIEDFYNFNPDRTSVKGRVGEKLQNNGDLEPYYIITVLKIPKEKWQK